MGDLHFKYMEKIYGGNSLRFGSVLLLEEVSRSIFYWVNLGGLIQLLKKNMEKIILNQTIFFLPKKQTIFGTAKGIKYIKNSYSDMRCVQNREMKKHNKVVQ